MCKLLLSLFAVFILSATLHAQSQSEMNQEAGEELEKADKVLNQTYRAVLADHSDDPEFCADLKEAQRAWLKFVEYHLKTKFSLKEGESPREVYGSIFPMDFAAEKTALIEARIAQLKDL